MLHRVPVPLAFVVRQGAHVAGDTSHGPALAFGGRGQTSTSHQTLCSRQTTSASPFARFMHLYYPVTG